MTFLKKHNLLIKILAILIAFILWAIVVTTDDLERTLEFSGVKVNLIGNSTLLAEKELMVLDSGSYTVSLKLRGNFNRLKNITADDITVRADVSGVTEAGRAFISYDISVPNGISIDSRYPEKLTLQVDEMVFRELPVNVVINNEATEEYQFGEPSVKPNVVGVRALSSELKNAAYATVVIDSDVLTSDYSEKLIYRVTDMEGNDMTFTKINYVDPSVNVTIPVDKIKNVPFTVSATGTIGVSSSNVVASCTPDSVTIIGKSEIIDEIESIELGKVNASDFLSSGETEFTFTLPEGTDFKNEPFDTVKVLLSLKNTVVNQLTITDFVLENLPEGKTASVETQNIVLNIRGPRDTVIKLTPEDFTVKIDFANMNVQNGRQVLDVSITSEKDGFDIYGSYSIIVNITGK